jgi:hypothetical protein
MQLSLIQSFNKFKEMIPFLYKTQKLTFSFICLLQLLCFFSLEEYSSLRVIYNLVDISENIHFGFIF